MGTLARVKKSVALDLCQLVDPRLHAVSDRLEAVRVLGTGVRTRPLNVGPQVSHFGQQPVGVLDDRIAHAVNLLGGVDEAVLVHLDHLANLVLAVGHRRRLGFGVRVARVADLQAEAVE
jgi:hypothetical protein